jgi:hypothetical protein
MVLAWLKFLFWNRPRFEGTGGSAGGCLYRILQHESIAVMQPRL